MTRICAIPLMAAVLAGCAPQMTVPGPATTAAALTHDTFRTSDGLELPLRRWRPAGESRAIILALHGFNDYGTFVTQPAAFFNRHGIDVYAYDQRGFGAAPDRGRWPGTQAFADDLNAAVALLRARHPGLSIYLVGASMGGAVIMTAMTSETPPDVAGVILSAPAVWGRRTMPLVQRGALWIAAHTMPWLKLSGQGLNIQPSDNTEMLRALGRDPLVIKRTRTDTIYGLVNLMDAALAAAPKFDARALILYGENDEIIKKEPTDLMIAGLPERAHGRQRIVRYPQGFHMLLRDLQRETVWRDIIAWIDGADGPLPSEAAASSRR